MISKTYRKAMTEVIHYLKGIRQEDIDKIPKSFIKYLNDNSDKEYECTFDYNKPIKELNSVLLEETKSILGIIALQYWCENEDEKKKLMGKFNENDKKHQEYLKEKYNFDNMFKNVKEENSNDTNLLIDKEDIKKKNNIFTKILNKIKSVFIK